MRIIIFSWHFLGVYSVLWGLVTGAFPSSVQIGELGFYAWITATLLSSVGFSAAVIRSAAPSLVIRSVSACHITVLLTFNDKILDAFSAPFTPQKQKHPPPKKQTNKKKISTHTLTQKPKQKMIHFFFDGFCFNGYSGLINASVAVSPSSILHCLVDTAAHPPFLFLSSLHFFLSQRSLIR